MADRIGDNAWVVYTNAENSEILQIEPGAAPNEQDEVSDIARDWMEVFHDAQAGCVAEKRDNILSIPEGPGAKNRLKRWFEDSMQDISYKNLPESLEKPRQRAAEAVKARWGSLCPLNKISFFCNYVMLRLDDELPTSATAEAFFTACYEEMSLYLAVRTEVDKIMKDPVKKQRLGADAIETFSVDSSLFRNPEVVERLSTIGTEDEAKALVQEIMNERFRTELNARIKFEQMHKAFVTEAVTKLEGAGVSEKDARQLVEKLGNGWPNSDAEYRNQRTGCLEQLERLIGDAQKKLRGKLKGYLDVMEKYDSLMENIKKTGKRVVQNYTVLNHCNHPWSIELASIAQQNLAGTARLTEILREVPLDLEALKGALLQFVENAVDTLENSVQQNALQILRDQAISLADLGASAEWRVQVAKVMITMHLARNAELARLLNNQALGVMEALKHVEKLRIRFADDPQRSSCFMGVMTTFVDNDITDRLMALNTSANIVEDLKRGTVDPEIEKFTQRMHALYGDLVQTDLSQSDVWQKVKTSITEKAEAGGVVTAAEVSNAYAQALMKRVVESMVPKRFDGAVITKGFELSGFMKSSAMRAHLEGVYAGKDEKEFANALADEVTKEIAMQQGLKDGCEAIRNRVIQSVAEEFKVSDATVRNKVDEELRSYVDVLLNQWFSTEVEKRRSINEEFSMLENLTAVACKMMFRPQDAENV